MKMTCSTPNQVPDWKAYALGEMHPQEREAAEAHAHTCEACREELAVLRLTLDSLSTLPEIEIPRRIAFVSDPVFEKPASAPWWQMFVNPTFAAAAALAMAILAHGVMATGGANEEQMQARVDAAVAEQVTQLKDLQEYMAVKLGELEEKSNEAQMQTLDLVRY